MQYASIKLDSGASNAGGVDDLIFTSGAGTWELHSIEGFIWYAPEPYSVTSADLVPPVPIAGVYTVATGTGPSPINGHLGNIEYVNVKGPSIMDTVDITTTLTANYIGQWYGINLDWEGVYQVIIPTDWYVSCGLASPNLAGHWRGHVRLGFY